MAEFDLTSTLGQYLDRHLVFPLLEFLTVKGLYDEKEMLMGKLDLLNNTKMVDFAMDVHNNLYPDQQIPQALKDKRAQVVYQLKVDQAEANDIAVLFDSNDITALIKTSRDGRQLYDVISKEYGFTHKMTTTLYDYAKFQYECGNYGVAAEYLYFVTVLTPPSDPNLLSALWGKLASEILMQNWDYALEDLNKVKDLIDNNSFQSDLMTLQQRTWVIHWSLFVYFNHPKGRDFIIDQFLYTPTYLNAIQTTCPHILRYLTTAVITNKQRRRTVLKDLVKIIQMESYTYKDPITEFVQCLYVDFDFDGAQKKLRECEMEDILIMAVDCIYKGKQSLRGRAPGLVLFNDFFLVACLEDFIENARLLIFETFCRIHECISISMLAEKLNMSRDDAERWIVNLIRNARLDAKIDSQLGHVVMGTQAVSPYQLVIEKTKNLSFRSQMLALNIEKKLGNRGNQDNQWSQE